MASVECPGTPCFRDLAPEYTRWIGVEPNGELRASQTPPILWYASKAGLIIRAYGVVI